MSCSTGPQKLWNSFWHLYWELGSAGKESACNTGDLGLIPGLGGSPGEGKGYPLQFSVLENSRDCIVHGVTNSQTWLSDFYFTLLHFIQELRYHWKIGNCELDGICFSKCMGEESSWVAQTRSWWLIYREVGTFKKYLKVGWVGFDVKVDTGRERCRVIYWNGKRGFGFEVFEAVRIFWICLGSLKAEVKISLLIPASVWVVSTSLRHDGLEFA